MLAAAGFTGYKLIPRVGIYTNTPLWPDRLVVAASILLSPLPPPFTQARTPKIIRVYDSTFFMTRVVLYLILIVEFQPSDLELEFNSRS